MGIRSHWKNYIDGHFIDSVAGRTIEVEDPATGEKIAEIARAEAGDVHLAVAAAKQCFDSRALADLRPINRGRMLIDVARELRRRQDEIAEVICHESGMGMVDSIDQVDCAAQYFEYYGGLADKIEGSYIPLGKGFIDYTIPEPHGVSAHIIPWNFPIELVARGVAPALAAGNTVVIKSPELDPLHNTFLGEIAGSVGFPDGAINIIAGYGDDCGSALCEHPDVNQLVFTGSVPTGRKILDCAARRIIPAVVELGGKSAGMVMPDADLDKVVASTRVGIFFFSGQVCSAMSRLLVHRSIYDDVVDRLCEMVDGLSIGHGKDNSDITPLISERQLQRVEGLVQSAVDAGAKIARGGARVADSPGYFMQPTLICDASPDMDAMQQEAFGPVLCISAFDSEEEGVSIANGTRYGLCAGVFTQDLEAAHRIAARLKGGQIFINKWFAGGIETPFGGVGESGFGREKGQDAIRNYYQTKNVGCQIG